MNKVYEIKLVITVDEKGGQEIAELKNNILSGGYQREIIGGKYGILKAKATFTEIKGGEQ